MPATGEREPNVLQVSNTEVLWRSREAVVLLTLSLGLKIRDFIRVTYKDAAKRNKQKA